MTFPNPKILYSKYKMYEEQYLTEESVRYKFEALMQMRNYGILLQKALMLDNFKSTSSKIQEAATY